MAKKATTKKVEKKVADPKANYGLQDVIISPRITEKGGVLAEVNAYVFNVAPKATKVHIAKAVQTLYGVTPTKVAIITIKSKKTVARGKRGTKGGGKKAYVYLKKGDTIQLV